MTDSGKAGLFSLASGLWMISVLYGNAVRFRILLSRLSNRDRKKLSCAVISVGNLTMGGTGKTPMTAYLAESIRKMGLRVVVVSRGYGGSAVKGGGVVSDGKTIRMTPVQSGDEPYMLAEQLAGVPVLVGKDRYRMGLEAERQFKPQVLILDDGFQHLSLFRDLDLVLLDGRMPIGNGHLFPRGVLREPLSAMRRADAFILTRFDPSRYDVKTFIEFEKKGYFNQKPLFRSVHVPCFAEVSRGCKTSLDPGRFIGKKVTAFSGIAQNEDFRATLEKSGFEMASFHPFSDHHPYTPEELESIRIRAKNSSSGLMATTEKDYSRIRGWEVSESKLIVVGIRTSVLEKEAFLEFIGNKINSTLNRTDMR
ncbi:MAG: tetraacyldisaccharide 4'-kinase [Thermodesulfobacteriota bacterium]